MKPIRHLLGAAAVLAITGTLIAITWIGAVGSVRSQRTDTEAAVETAMANQARLLAEQLDLQIRMLDQSLRIFATAWQTDPARFNMAQWRGQMAGLEAISSDFLMTDESGIIRQSSVIDAIGQPLPGQEDFRTLAEQTDQTNRMYLGPPTISSALRQWHMAAARALHRADGSFAGLVVIDYRLAAVADALGRAELGSDGFAALIGLRDGRLRGVVASGTVDPGISIGDSRLLPAMRLDPSGTWSGRSPVDAVPRIHAFHRLPDRDLAVVLAVDRQAALQPAAIWRQQTWLFAGCLTAMLLLAALLLLRANRGAAQRAAMLRQHALTLAELTAERDVARSTVATKAEQLQATLNGLQDGLSIFDAQICLVEWNDRFAEVAGFPASLLRVGLPMEQILRAQAIGGQFGKIDSVDAEVARRMVRVRSGPHGVVRRQRPDGHTIELRRKALPQGGFVTLYSDITEHLMTEEALRTARTQADAMARARANLLAAACRGIAGPLNAMTDALQSQTADAPEQAILVRTTRQSAMALRELAEALADIALIEADRLTLQPALFDLAGLLRGAASLVRTPAAARGITIRVAKTDGEAVALFADAARLRQSLRTILTCALRQAGPGAITLAAEAATDPAQPIRLVVRDSGPALTAEQASRLFAPLSQFVLPPDGEADAGWAGSALDLAVCHELIVRMGGQMGWQAWRTPDGQDGNMVWLSLPASALPALPAPGTPAPAAAARTRVEQADMRLPRTRILLAEDVVANQIVAATLLRREGHMVDIAVDGLAAVEALRNTPYDVVFMDIMMPGMNGRDAAAAIRLLPEPARSVPIIALTADTSGGDETSFRAAGMNAMLGKPVALPELLNAMRIHAWSRSPQDVVPDAQPAGEQTGADRPAAAPETRSSGVPAGQAGALPAPIATSPREPVLATERLAELRGNLPPATFVALIEECLTDLDSRLPALRRAFATGSPGAITAHSHAMVGMAAGYGMAALEARLRRVTAAARAGDLTPLGPDVMPQIEADLAAAARALRELMQDVLA